MVISEQVTVGETGEITTTYSELVCPRWGVDCDGGIQTYIGGVWHDTSVATPNCARRTVDDEGRETWRDCTNIYTCVNNGCPVEGATKMECKPGYHGPLCALCDDSYYKSIRDCVPCERVQIGKLVAFVLGFLVLIALLLCLVRRYHHYLNHAAAFSRECHI
jgi:hypothetical protein